MTKPAVLNPEDLPEEFGRYKISKRLGKGGMGAVYRAWDPALEREVALKVPFLKQNDSTFIARFQREARSAAAVQHSGICAIYDVGEYGGVPFFTMQFVQGESLADLLERGEPLVPEMVVKICYELASAVQSAHEQGVLHRDLKPSNIMLDLAGNPRILDFGLSRRMDSDENLTATGQLMGTPAYMSPEQARGSHGEIGPQTDIFSLGVIFYEMLTGKRPFEGDSLPALLLSIIATNPKPPSELRPGLDKKLDAICLKAIAKKPKKRYATAGALATDLAAVQADLSLPSFKLSSRQSRMMGIAAGSLILILLLMTFFLNGNRGPDETLAQNSTANASENNAAGNNAVGKSSEDNNRARPPESHLASHQGGTSNVDTPDSSPATSDKTDSTSGEQKTSLPTRPNDDLAVAAITALTKYCYDCHGLDFAVPGFDVKDRRSLIAQADEDSEPYIRVGDPEHSLLWERVGLNEDMPPSDSPQPTSQERQLIAKWISEGAPFPALQSRPHITQNEALESIKVYLLQQPSADRRYQRFFTLLNLHNSSDMGSEGLNRSRAALSKVVNSLSWSKEIVIPHVIDEAGTVMAIDIRDVGWTLDQWEEILKYYPYGIRPATDDPSSANARQIAEESGTQISTVRLDWFIVTASQPPLYEHILGLPHDVAELERKLNVNVIENFLNGRVQRAAFLTSGVSDQNRLVDRHDALYGAYWKSYDFVRNDETGDLMRFPLGPQFHGNPYEKHAFEQDGGEMIFNLPNGLQAYLLTDAKGRQIPEGPIQVVSDAAKSSGSNVVVNGISCMFCHREGMIDFEDQIRTGTALKGEALEKTKQLFVPKDEMQKALNNDRERFMAALHQAVLPLLEKSPEDSWPELVNFVTRRYLRDLTLEDLAVELGYENVTEFENVIRPRMQFDADLERLGVKPVLNGGRIPRSIWSEINIPTRFQEMSRQLRGSIPLTVF
ncbi:protein kinase domain-containing protein [Thalassoglobus polymorphus]|uniref:non-specific serine/threonine protein kinase n=1 Tax=Thalassoglobus polymorphus TaxID=2527994 RepID=A0A517QMK9_9PLAN|nr:protein kinase [Thalassoglobus polymorphus]QDT32787.1 Serine/threonine-protein kinase PknB [Thalassoglobus polymorphus]